MVEQGKIEKSETDTIQPYRVWYKNHIIWFARTLEEANVKLAEERRRDGRYGI